MELSVLGHHRERTAWKRLRPNPTTGHRPPQRAQPHPKTWPSRDGPHVPHSYGPWRRHSGHVSGARSQEPGQLEEPDFKHQQDIALPPIGSAKIAKDDDIGRWQWHGKRAASLSPSDKAPAVAELSRRCHHRF